MSFKIKLDSKELFFDKKIKLIDLTNNDKNIICARVNNRTRDLDYQIDFDADVRFLTLKSSSAMGIYENSIRYLFCMASHILYPNLKFKLTYSVSRSIYAQVLNKNKLVNVNMVNAISDKMQELVNDDLPFERMLVDKEKALAMYKRFGMDDKAKVIKYRPEKNVHFYKCGDYYNYMFGRMVPSTGYLKNFILRVYSPGLLISYPRSDLGGKIPTFKDEPTFSSALFDAQYWGNLVGMDSVSGINTSIKNTDAVETINICENRQYRMLCELGQRIEDRIDNIRLICIAGPSSSGKTTFSDRLVMELESRGIHPIRISLDDYYKTRENVPLGEDGTPDFEAIDALDKEQFNKDIVDLLDGKIVTLPVFDFKTNKRNPGRTLKISERDPIVIEGIHALNEDMTSLIPKFLKFKIYISPQAQINIDRENPISITDIRLLRRIVRDFKYRNASAEETFSMWPNVRKGEFKWIYNTQEDADYVFDSFLNYELCVLKKYAMPLLSKIEPDNRYFPEAERLIRLCKYFKDIDEKWIPCNSLLREFIGGNCYRDGKLSK
ncbi:MAG TPA: AAA family ATPase [Firmicutes bacterium]|nr:AAA family ATPase [Bacillota bacterium]